MIGRETPTSIAARLAQYAARQARRLVTPHTCRQCARTFPAGPHTGSDGYCSAWCRETARVPRAARAVVLALALLLTPAAALDWSSYDKQLHAAASFAGAYVVADVLERGTDLPPWARWMIAAGTLTAASWAYEELNASGYREANDAQAGTAGAVLGATAQVGLSLTLTRDRAAIGIAWRLR